MPSGRKPGKRKKKSKSDGCLKTDRHLFHDKRTKESPAGTDTVTGLIAKEMQQADTKQSLASAGQKLSYKYGQAAQISGADVLASVLKNIQVNTNTGNQLAQGMYKALHKTLHKAVRSVGIHAVFGNQFPGFRGWGRFGQWKGRKWKW